MKIPELSKTHKIAIFILVVLIVIILLIFAIPLGDKGTPSVNKDIPPETRVELITDKKNKLNKKLVQPNLKKKSAETIKGKSFINKNPEKVSLAQLFAPYRKDKSKAPDFAVKPMPVKKFAQMIIAEIDAFAEKDYKIIETALLNADKLNIGTIGLEFIKSENPKLQILGYELITKASIKNTQFFQPHKFFAAFAKKGFAAEPFITEIIESTQDDFCREWACELYIEIFYHNTDDMDSRHEHLTKVQQKEADLLKKIVKLLHNQKQIEKIIASKQNLGDQVRVVWGDKNRYPLKLLQIMKLLDNLNAKNQFPTTEKILKIIETYNFNYNILNHLNGEPVDLPPIPPEVELMYLANAIFGDKITNTFQWLHKKDGGFTKEEVKRALEKKDQKQIKHMNKVLHRIICAVLRGKLLLGLGNHELEILRYFYFGKWDKQQALTWKDNLLIIRNRNGKGSPLILATKPDTDKILTGKGVTSSNVEDRQETFYIPPQSVFIWFAANGDYILSVNKKNTVYKPEDLIYFKDKKITLKNQNITIDIY